MTATSVEAGQAIFHTLESLGVTHVFGLPGSQTVALFEALRRSRLTTVVPTHELAASFMAGAFYRVCGRPAVLLTIPGPGFTYALTGLAEARLDSAAMIYLVPAVSEGPDARFQLQAIPQTIIATALAKAVIRVDRVSEVAATLRKAYAVAMSGEPGPVVVQLGEALTEVLSPRKGVSEPAAPDPEGHAEVLWARIAAARRPIILAGQGCMPAAALRDLAEQLGAPVLTTASARGVLPEDHRLALGFDAHRGTTEAVNELLARADLVVVLGARLGHNGTAGHAIKLDPGRIIRVDTDPVVLGRVSAVSASVRMPVERFLSGRGAHALRTSDWSDGELTTAKLSISTPVHRAAEPRIAGMTAACFFDSLRAALPRDCVIVTDTGLHQVLARRHMAVLAPGGLLIPSDFQSMGFGLPAAIAAKLAAPQRPVVALVGDGGMAMSGMELATAARLGMPLPIVVFDDGQLNQIRLHQQAEFGTAFGVDLPSLDFEALASATGAGFLNAGSHLESALAEALSADGPTLLRVPVGDSIGVRRVQAVARTKALARRALGDRLIAHLRRRK